MQRQHSRRRRSFSSADRTALSRAHGTAICGTHDGAATAALTTAPPPWHDPAPPAPSALASPPTKVENQPPIAAPPGSGRTPQPALDFLPPRSLNYSRAETHSSARATSSRHDSVMSALPTRKAGWRRYDWGRPSIRLFWAVPEYKASPQIRFKLCHGIDAPASLVWSKQSSGSKFLSSADPESQTLGPVEISAAPRSSNLATA